VSFARAGCVRNRMRATKANAQRERRIRLAGNCIRASEFTERFRAGASRGSCHSAAHDESQRDSALQPKVCDEGVTLGAIPKKFTTPMGLRKIIAIDPG